MLGKIINPYSDLDKAAFWKTGVEQQDPFNTNGLYTKKWSIDPKAKIATAGSCFAQHISHYLNASGYAVMNVEPKPGGLPENVARSFGYGMYSARYGNIYSVAQLLQLLREVTGGKKLCADEVAWQAPAGAFFDALRPGVEPEGLPTIDDVLKHRMHHLERVRKMFLNMDVFIFTMGLTEVWKNKATDTYYPIAPGVFAGKFDPEIYAFQNLTFNENIEAIRLFHKELMELRGPDRHLRYILTVSPVPLTATASGNHVLPATIYSKSVLRAVAGQLSSNQWHFDYFPSYEIITNQANHAMFYERNLRSVRAKGVQTVMNTFFSEHPKLQTAREAAVAAPPVRSDEDLQCEEAVLEAFAV